MTDQKVPVRKIIWTNLIFFAVTTFVGILGMPFYYWHHAFSLPELVLFFFYLIVTPLSITMGYHRLFAHMSYKAHPLAQFFLLFFGAAAFEQSALKWASQHRTHHQFTDTPRDPYNIKKGFFYAHIGWLIFWQQNTDYANVPDLTRNKMVMYQHQYFKYWAIGSGIVLPLLLGSLTGNIAGAFLLSICLRLTLIYHGTFCINSICHTFGKATYDIYSSAKDHWFAALLTFGEGYHNYHHRFPSDYRNGVHWYHWDPTKWLINLLYKIGLASNLKRISKYRIIAAQLRAKHQRAENVLRQMKAHPKLENFQNNLKAGYEHLKQNLLDWEHQALSYRDLIRSRIANSSKQAQAVHLKQVDEARRHFKERLQQWEMLYLQILRFAN